MASASLLPPVSPTPVPTCSLAIEVPDARIWVYPQRFARSPCPRRCSSPRSPRLSRAPRRMVASEKEPTMALGTILPPGYVHEVERPCFHVPPARPAWLHRLSARAPPPLATSSPAHACGLQHRLGPSGGEAQGSHPLSVRYRRVNRSPDVAAEGHGAGLRRCGGRSNVLRRDSYEPRFYY